MKKYFYITLAAFVGLCSTTLTSCSGNDDGDDKVVEKPTALVLTVDKAEIEADGVSIATFKVVDQNGTDVTHVKGMLFVDNNTGAVSEVGTVTTCMNGASEYKARYNGVLSNVVAVTGINRKKYEKYFRNVGIFQMTGTWCQNCPLMGKTLDGVETILPNRLVRLAMHQGNGGQTDPFEIAQTPELNSQFGLGGAFPNAVIDLSAKVSSASPFGFVGDIKKSMKETPAACGIRITSAANATTKVATITPEVAFVQAGKYSIAGAILVDNLVASQAGADATYRHNNTARAFFGSDKGSLVGGLIGDKKDGDIWTPKDPFTVKLNANESIADTRVVVYVMKENAKGKFVITNIAVCPVNGTVDFKLND
ncbi:MAG: Omp28-related outer membrane protein [Alistipes sp.]